MRLTPQSSPLARSPLAPPATRHFAEAEEHTLAESRLSTLPTSLARFFDSRPFSAQARRVQRPPAPCLALPLLHGTHALSRPAETDLPVNTFPPLLSQPANTSPSPSNNSPATRTPNQRARGRKIPPKTRWTLPRWPVRARPRCWSITILYRRSKSPSPLVNRLSPSRRALPSPRPGPCTSSMLDRRLLLLHRQEDQDRSPSLLLPPMQLSALSPLLPNPTHRRTPPVPQLYRSNLPQTLPAARRTTPRNPAGRTPSPPPNSRKPHLVGLPVQLDQPKLSCSPLLYPFLLPSLEHPNNKMRSITRIWIS